jgi:hypothetical protein
MRVRVSQWKDLFMRDVLRSGATSNEHGAALVHSNQKTKVV